MRAVVLLWTRSLAKGGVRGTARPTCEVSGQVHWPHAALLWRYDSPHVGCYYLRHPPTVPQHTGCNIADCWDDRVMRQQYHEGSSRAGRTGGCRCGFVPATRIPRMTELPHGRADGCRRAEVVENKKLPSQRGSRPLIRGSQKPKLTQV